MTHRVKTHLMFDGTAEQAISFYISLFNNSEILRIDKYGPGEPGAEGSVKQAAFSLYGSEFVCIDSPIEHDFTFTPAMSIFVDCDSEAEIGELFGQLSAGGEVLMPLDNYGFSRQFAWTKDRFGVSWQLNLV